MAQQKAAKSKRAPSYSSGSLTARMLGGLALAALGVAVFLGLFLKMDGMVFRYLRQVSCSLFGGPALLFTAFLIWGGTLLLLSGRRKQPFRSFLFAVLLWLVFSAVLMLFSFSNYNGSAAALMDIWAQDSGSALKGYAPDSYVNFLWRAYELGARRHAGGGAFGMLLAWPLWRLAGATIGGILGILLMPGILFLLLRPHLPALRQRLAALRSRRSQHAQAERKQEAEYVAVQQMHSAPQHVQQAAPAPDPNAPAWQTHPNYTENRTGGFAPRSREHYSAQQGAQAQVHNVVPTRTAPQPAAAQQPKAQRSFPHLFGNRQSAEPAQQAGFVRTRRTMEETSPVSTRAAGASSQAAGWAREQPPQQPVWQPAPAEAVPQEAAAAAAGPTPEPASDPLPVFEPLPIPEPIPDPVPVPVQRAVSAPQAVPAQQAVPRAVPAQQAAPAPAAPAAPEAAPASAPQPAPARPAAKAPQKPKPSWTSDADRPPWEDPVPETPHELRIPVSTAPVLPGSMDPGIGEPFHPEPEKPPVRPYTFPSAIHLAQPLPPVGDQAEQDATRARIIEDTLASFGVKSTVVSIVHGPAVSRFELNIADGVRVSKVAGLYNDIAMKLAVPNVRVQAPIPGKTLVGIEVPNASVTPVVLREVLMTEVMAAAVKKSCLTVSLGKDISGRPVVCDLEKMPHLLIAGATGSGKSVCINSIIISLLYQTTPQQLRLIMIDPKVVELKPFNGIPHLLLPVVNDPHKAAGALQWAVNEMMDRYDKFAELGVRNIFGYNAAIGPDAEPMPRIVIIVDELADLMVVCKKDVESHIQRLTQLARAAGIHLIIATQRPSVNVITGVIKANIPSRIAFKTTSQTDSRTILDHMGAEGLIGRGDMLYMPTGAFSPTRVQGCFLKDEEVEAVVTDILAHNDTNYDEKVTEALEQSEHNAEGAGDSYASPTPEADTGDSMLLQAIEITVQDGQVSTSMLQRKLSLGYARAARIVDRMEELGIVSQKDGAKPRYCLIDRERFEEMKSDGTLG